MSDRQGGINLRGALRRTSRHATTVGMSRDAYSTRIWLPDLSATASLGARIAAGLRKGDLVALEGELGAGKTTLARATLHAMGVAESVPSPTFTLVQTYDTRRFPVRHYDLYRIEHPEELEELGLEEALDEGAVLMEWPERAGNRLPGDTLHIVLTSTDTQSRYADISGPARWASFLESNSV
jgi:tRNA threonylcarbamoyladenosine biosynthesis protein TsaE